MEETILDEGLELSFDRAKLPYLRTKKLERVEFVIYTSSIFIAILIFGANTFFIGGGLEWYVLLDIMEGLLGTIFVPVVYVFLWRKKSFALDHQHELEVLKSPQMSLLRVLVYISAFIMTYVGGVMLMELFNKNYGEGMCGSLFLVAGLALFYYMSLTLTQWEQLEDAWDER